MEMSIKDYANHRNVSKSMVYKYLAEGAISGGSVTDGKPKKILVERADYELAMNVLPFDELQPKKNDESLLYHRTRLTQINADKRALELAQMRGELIPTKEATKLWGAVMMHIVNKLEALPLKLPPLLLGLTAGEMKAEISRFMIEVRNEIANPDLEKMARLGFFKEAGKTAPKKKMKSKKSTRRRLG